MKSKQPFNGQNLLWQLVINHHKEQHQTKKDSYFATMVGLKTFRLLMLNGISYFLKEKSLLDLSWKLLSRTGTSCDTQYLLLALVSPLPVAFCCYHITVTSSKVFSAMSLGQYLKPDIFQLYVPIFMRGLPKRSSSFPTRQCIKSNQPLKTRALHASDKSEEGHPSSLDPEEPRYSSQVCHITSLQVTTLFCTPHMKWRLKMVRKKV